MSRRKHKKVPRGSQAGRAVSPKQKEEMLQIYSIEGNFNEVARKMGLSVACVSKHIKLMLREPDQEINAARRLVARELAGRTTAKASGILNSIQEHDMESGLIKMKDKDGELVGVRAYGPSLVQKTTAFAIMTDKIGVIQGFERVLAEEQHSGRAELPSNMADLIAGVQSKLKSLTFLNVRFQEDEPALSQRVQSVLEDAQIVEDAEVRNVSMDMFDGN